MRFLRILSAACLAVAGLAASAGADPFAPVTVTLPPEGQGDIFSPGVRLVADLDDNYVEEEYFVSGSVDVWRYNDPPQLHELVLRDDVPTDYTTRIIIRRPADDSEFTGNVAVEWWNSTAQFDTAPVWDPSAEWFAREGWIYVGVSNADEAVNFLRFGCRLFGGPPTCGTRYTDLSLPEDGIAYEMVSQIVNLLRGDSTQNPLRELEVQHVFHAGQSQQAGSVNTYAREFHEDSLNDGYFIQAGSGSPRTVSSGSPNFGFGDPRGLPPTQLSVPVVRAQTETEVQEFGVVFNRQTDDDNFRYYEIAGATHLTVHKDVEVIPGNIFFPGAPPVTLENLCLNPLNTLVDGPVFGKYVYNAMWKNMERQVIDAVPPPHGDIIQANVVLVPIPDPPFFELDVQIVRDGDGNAEGGIRTPDMNVPIGSYFDPTNEAKPACGPPPGGPFLPNCNPIGNLGNLACFLGGSTTPFDQTTLDDKYPSHQIYVDDVSTDADRLSDEGFLLNRDSKEIVDRAEAADIP
jgi:hypothetical protein